MATAVIKLVRIYGERSGNRAQGAGKGHRVGRAWAGMQKTTLSVLMVAAGSQR